MLVVLRTLAVIAGAATVIAAAWTTAAIDRDLFPGKLPGGVSAPILALELGSSEKDVTRVLGAPDEPQRSARQAAIVGSLARDRLFIVAYTAWLVLLGALLVTHGVVRDEPRWRLAGLGAAAVLLAAVAAVCDVNENRQLATLVAAARPDPSLKAWTLWKFGAFYGALGLGSFSFFLEPGRVGVQRWLRRVAGLTGIIAGVVGIAGAVLGWPGGIEGGILFAAVAILSGTVFFATIHWLRDGLLAALDRLGERPVLCWLANWPSDE